MSSYERDRGLEVKMLPSLKAILAGCFITQSEVADLKEGTDFLVLTVKPFRVGCRLRRFGYLKHYPNDFTIRWQRPSGVQTEIHKIRGGLVDYILYGFVNQEETKIIKWFLGDLKVFREVEQHIGIEPLVILRNDPYDSDFAVYSITQLPSNFIIKSASLV